MSDNAPIPGNADRRGPQPESFRARTLSASLTVNDIHASLAWYRDVVGFHVEEEWQRDGELAGAELKAGTVTLFIDQDDGAKGWDRVKGVGFSLYLITAQDVDELAARIIERGGTLASEPEDMPWGPRAFRVRDPDGFTMTIASEELDER